MQVLPSKELLSEVLDKGKGSITKIEHNPSKTIVEYEQLERYWNSINIYELAHKCKEWALNKNNLELISAITEEGAYCKIDNMLPSTI